MTLVKTDITTCSYVIFNVQEKFKRCIIGIYVSVLRKHDAEYDDCFTNAKQMKLSEWNNAQQLLYLFFIEEFHS